MSQQKWQRSSLRRLSQQLQGAISHTTVERLLKEMNYSLKANVKRLAGKSHPDRNRQFLYIEQQKQSFLLAKQPVISVDAKKKEAIGNFKNSGQKWCQAADEVNDHDFVSEAIGKAVPYGIYDVGRNRGWVYVGQSADTAQFAVEMIAKWWQDVGCRDYPLTNKLLILCDGGGSNGYRLRLWKQQVQELLADRLGLEVTICHYPTGTSKWNPIEHRLFGAISINWAGQPLRTYEVMLALIRGTVTETGLKVEAFLIETVYRIGLKVADKVMKTLQLERHTICPNWNYTIRPRLLSATCL